MFGRAESTRDSRLRVDGTVSAKWWVVCLSSVC